METKSVPPRDGKKLDKDALTAAGFKVHCGDRDGGDDLCGKWWWTLSQPNWGGVEVSEAQFEVEEDAWADAAKYLDGDHDLSSRNHEGE